MGKNKNKKKNQQKKKAAAAKAEHVTEKSAPEKVETPVADTPVEETTVEENLPSDASHLNEDAEVAGDSQFSETASDLLPQADELPIADANQSDDVDDPTAPTKEEPALEEKIEVDTVATTEKSQSAPELEANEADSESNEPNPKPPSASLGESADNEVKIENEGSLAAQIARKSDVDDGETGAEDKEETMVSTDKTEVASEPVITSATDLPLFVQSSNQHAETNADLADQIPVVEETFTQAAEDHLDNPSEEKTEERRVELVVGGVADETPCEEETATPAKTDEAVCATETGTAEKRSENAVVDAEESPVVVEKITTETTEKVGVTEEPPSTTEKTESGGNIVAQSKSEDSNESTEIISEKVAQSSEKSDATKKTPKREVVETAATSEVKKADSPAAPEVVAPEVDPGCCVIL